MAKLIKAIRGMNDIVPTESGCWQFVEDVFKAASAAYAYKEIRFPIVESQQLFSRAVGDVTDIVEKEMYVFQDRNEEWLAMRPEGTAGCVRAAIQQNLLYKQTQRLWYCGPMFRYERPQQGRYRQFQQFGIEAFGFAEPFADAEIIALSARVWQKLGISHEVRLELNSLGSLDARQQYRDVLIQYFTDNLDQLDDDSRRRLESNPLRILDSKNPALKPLIQAAPKLADHINEADQQHFAVLCNLLDTLGIAYTVNPCLVRGLDYYNRTVFEWVTDKLGAQGTICAGGRYDDLVSWLGGQATPAVGFAAGLERIVELVKLTEHAQAHQAKQSPDIYFISQSDAARAQAMVLSENIREHCAAIKVCQHLGEGSFKSQFKRADQSGARFAIILAEDELLQKKVSVKYLREDKPQCHLAMDELVTFLQNETAGRPYAHI